jgi:branched-chain amino acid aminotransferase
MGMLAYVNGRYVAAEVSAIGVNDRSFLYGDGLFETIRITNGQPFLWREHVARLERGAAFLRIPLEASAAELEFAVRHLLVQNDCPEGMVRIHVSRGPSERGYSTKGAVNPTVVITTHRAIHERGRGFAGSAGLKLITSSVRVLADDPLTEFKTANRLPMILARREAEEAGADEALILNHRGEVAEASAANVFCVRGKTLVTPPLSAGALAGTTRGFVLRVAAKECEFVAEEGVLNVEDLRAADGVFLTSAHWLVAGVVSVGGVTVREAAEVVGALRGVCERG